MYMVNVHIYSFTVELKKIPFQVDVINLVKLLILGEEDKSLNSE